jgi:hypothetical protein
MTRPGDEKEHVDVEIHEHALGRLPERGATKEEILQTVQGGEVFPAKYGRTGFRRNFAYGALWRGRHYETKQVEAYAVWENDSWLVITIITKYF